MHNTIPDLESGRRPGKVRVRWEIYFLKVSDAAVPNIHSTTPPGELGGFPREPVHLSGGKGRSSAICWLGIVSLP